jgi:hypothetical protein
MIWNSLASGFTIYFFGFGVGKRLVRKGPRTQREIESRRDIKTINHLQLRLWLRANYVEGLQLGTSGGKACSWQRSLESVHAQIADTILYNTAVCDYVISVWK